MQNNKTTTRDTSKNQKSTSHYCDSTNTKNFEDLTNTSNLEMLKSESRVDRAVEYFMSGYNCSQSIFATYCDLFGIPCEQGLLISAGLGAGVGRMREVCGTVSASAMLLGLKYGTTDSNDLSTKSHMYKKIQDFAGEFKEIYPSVICRDLLGDLAKNKGSMPDERTEEYYKKRPCVKIVRDAAVLIEKYLTE